jgi:SAM-dependent methyltransferase
MRPGVEELQAFYATRRGQLARRLVNAQLRALWSEVRGETVVGLGYPIPFLPVLDGARTIAIMPAAQGCARWPAQAASRVILAREDELPLEDGAADRVLLAHALEHAADPRRLLREIWRVLADGGRLLLIVPNRAGFWCWSDATPFGVGQPYSSAQVAAALAGQLFERVGERRALFMPPVMGRLWPRLAVSAERIGSAFAPGFAGVLMIEAEKRIAAGTVVRWRQPLVRSRRMAGVRAAVARELELPDLVAARRLPATPFTVIEGADRGRLAA